MKHDKYVEAIGERPSSEQMDTVFRIPVDDGPKADKLVEKLLKKELKGKTVKVQKVGV